MKSAKTESSNILTLAFKQVELYHSGKCVPEVFDLTHGQTPDHAAVLSNKVA